MEFQETGRLGRITKNLRKHGFEDAMKEILHDSLMFNSLKKADQATYLETVMERMVTAIGQDNAMMVMRSCGEQCCGKSWAAFARNIWENSNGTVEDFVEKLNHEERKYSTSMMYDREKNEIKVFRSQCICGMINNGGPFTTNTTFCTCSTGHMEKFFNAVFDVNEVTFIGSIMNGAGNCEWSVSIAPVNAC